MQQNDAGTPSLSVAAPYTSFGLTDFWLGCSVHTGEAAAGLATQCTVTVVGFNSAGKEVVVDSFTFTPPAARFVT